MGKREGQKKKAKFKIIKRRCGKRGQKRTESEGVGLMLGEGAGKVATENEFGEREHFQGESKRKVSKKERIRKWIRRKGQEGEQK